jgi:hypothetical protein
MRQACWKRRRTCRTCSHFVLKSLYEGIWRLVYVNPLWRNLILAWLCVPKTQARGMVETSLEAVALCGASLLI